MGGLDPRFGPEPQNVTVTREYLHEMYEDIAVLRRRCAGYECVLGQVLTLPVLGALLSSFDGF